MLLLLLACAGDPADDTAAPTVLEIAPLATISDGACPDLSATGESTFSSGGEDRTVNIIVPAQQTADMPVVFFFHGLMSPDYTPDPTQYMADALDLQAMADEEGAVIVLPESRLVTMYGQTFFMWDVVEQDTQDLIFYDDLRSCVLDGLDTDPEHLAVMGISGGALFTTVLIRERSDTMASAVSMSGGADIENSLFDNLLARYGTPLWNLPTLLWAGGEDDAWPDPSMPVVSFEEATDTLEAHLVEDGVTTVRCEHNRGHNFTPAEIQSARHWALAHEFEQPSPYADDLGDMPDGCYIAE